MRSYWIWLSLTGVTWALSLVHFSTGSTDMVWRFLGSAVFFSLFFLTPLVRNRPVLAGVNLMAAALTAVIVLWPEANEAMDPYPLLVFSLVAGKAVYRLSTIWAFGVGAVLLIGNLLPAVFGYPSFSPIFLVIYSGLLLVVFAYFKKSLVREAELEARNEALLSEYRKMKRRLLADEQSARQEERAQIARDIHDSVGHKLTALLMQLEVFRMQTDRETAEHVQGLKLLAKESLEETRKAVKTLKHDEEGGVSAIIGLIRKLEAESFLRIQFAVKPGAFSVQLGNEQMVIVYRAVQEALTNIMRHSQTREADIIFEAPGGSIFRFIVKNGLTENIPFREGFGLSSMRERIEQAGGQLEAGPQGKEFVVKGTLPLLKKGGSRYDSHFTGRRSSHGAPRVENDD